MANEFLLASPDDMLSVASFVCDHFENEGKPLKVVITQRNNGTMPMRALWAMWMVDIAKYQSDRGATMPILAPETKQDGSIGWKVIGSRPFNETDAHEAYTKLCLGCDENGVRFSWAVNSETYEGRKVADIGRKLHAMQKFHQFCIDNAIPIRIPETSEYQQLQDQQNGK